MYCSILGTNSGACGVAANERGKSAVLKTRTESTARTDRPDASGQEGSLVSTALTACVDFDIFRRQETTIILLNLAVIASLLMVQLIFQSVLGLPSRLVIASSEAVS